MAAIKLPCGAYVRFLQHGTRSDAPHTVHIVEFAQSGNGPWVKWDATVQWSGPHPDPASRILRHLDGVALQAFAPPPEGRAHYDRGIEAVLSNAPDPHGNLTHPSMKALATASPEAA
jgi:hypothetical protein